MRAGQLDVPLRLQEATESLNPAGEPIKTWATVATCWARQVASTGGEGIAGDQTFASRAMQWRMRFHPRVNAKARFLHPETGTLLDIQHVDPQRRQGEMVVTTVERDV